MIKFFEKAPYAPVEYCYDVEEILYKGKSRFQEIMVIKNPYFGKMLILDNIVQLTERDEFFYHEMLTQVVMHAHPNPKKVVVIGGGDGGVVREVLKHKGVEKVYFVEIDEEVVNISKRFFPTVASSVDDLRVEIKIMDGAEFLLRKKPSDINIIIVDSTDIIGIARSLYTDEFFNAVRDSLAEDGMYVAHSESLHFHKDMVIEIQETLKKVFPLVDLYTTPIATYPGNWWTFSCASKKYTLREVRRPCTVETKFYDEEVHLQSFFPGSLYKKLLNKTLTW